MKPLVVFLVLLAMIAQSSECTANEAVPLLAKNRKGDTIAVRAMSDPGNPYTGTYEVWDYWAIQNTNPELSIKSIPEGWKRLLDENHVEGGRLHSGVEEAWFSLFPPNWHYQRIHVDTGGFLIPATVYTEMVEENRLLTDSRFCFKDSKLPVYLFYAEGPISPDLQQQMAEANWDVRVNYYPPVPAWLLEHYISAVILPDGSFITKNPLEEDKAWLQSIAQSEGNKYVAWTHYSANGEVIDFITDYTRWMGLTNPDYPTRLESGGGRLTSSISGSYIIRSDIQTGRVLSVFDYTGKSLPFDAPIYPPGHYCEVLNSFELQAVFNARHRRLANERIASGDACATPGI